MRAMEYLPWINILLVLLLFPLKSESSEDPNLEEKLEDSDDDDFQTNKTDSVTAVSKTEKATTTTIQTIPDGMPMEQRGQDEFQDIQKETNIAVKVGVPVALLGLMLVLGIIRLVSSGQLNNRVLGLRRIFGKAPDESMSLYTQNGVSSANRNNKTSNPIYAMQSGYDSTESTGKPPSGNGFNNMEKGVYAYDNLELFKNDPDSTYQTIADGQLNPPIAKFAKFNGQTPALQQTQFGETAYDNNRF